MGTAAQLDLSPAAVEAGMSQILTKLRFRNRTQAAALRGPGAGKVR
ncbi:LuxR C-terminal-related transcriptional regulator [Georgenia sp. TF02-10]|nr:LuxR C-terminal-related transcriptional regulator [Georgenia sp. TF02-10]UNX55818.1 LuxR C-terminal-related transcriptional regulator [Georgenia sp. TF02-10]